jgi:hypothetical protein
VVSVVVSFAGVRAGPLTSLARRACRSQTVQNGHEQVISDLESV